MDTNPKNDLIKLIREAQKKIDDEKAAEKELDFNDG